MTATEAFNLGGMMLEFMYIIVVHLLALVGAAWLIAKTAQTLIYRKRQEQIRRAMRTRVPDTYRGPRVEHRGDR